MGHSRCADPQVMQVLLQCLAQPVQALRHVRHLHRQARLFMEVLRPARYSDGTGRGNTGI